MAEKYKMEISFESDITETGAKRLKEWTQAFLTACPVPMEIKGCEISKEESPANNKIITGRYKNKLAEWAYPNQRIFIPVEKDEKETVCTTIINAITDKEKPTQIISFNGRLFYDLNIFKGIVNELDDRYLCDLLSNSEIVDVVFHTCNYFADKALDKITNAEETSVIKIDIKMEDFKEDELGGVELPEEFYTSLKLKFGIELYNSLIVSCILECLAHASGTIIFMRTCNDSYMVYLISDNLENK